MDLIGFLLMAGQGDQISPDGRGDEEFDEMLRVIRHQ